MPRWFTGWLDDSPYDRDDEDDHPVTAMQFIVDRFMHHVADQGGRELSDTCYGDELPDLTKRSDREMVSTQGCGGQTRFELPYEREDGSVATVVACAACDLAIRWPRMQP